MEGLTSRIDEQIEQRLVEEGGDEIKALIDDTKRLVEDLSYGSHLCIEDDRKKVLIQSHNLCAASEECTLTNPIDKEGTDSYVQCVICRHGAHRKCTIGVLEKELRVCKDCVKEHNLKRTEVGNKKWVVFSDQSVQDAIEQASAYHGSRLMVFDAATFEKYMKKLILANDRKEDAILNPEEYEDEDEDDHLLFIGRKEDRLFF